MVKKSNPPLTDEQKNNKPAPPPPPPPKDLFLKEGDHPSRDDTFNDAFLQLREKRKKMYKTRKEYAKMILEDAEIELAICNVMASDNFDDYQKIIEDILAKYDSLKVLR